VHFREPGLTHKGDIESESRAAIAGGTTSFIEQPNTVPNAVTQELLADKYEIASQKSFANYGFMMGGTNDNLEEVLKQILEMFPESNCFLVPLQEICWLIILKRWKIFSAIPKC
jgi:dihydroorotase